MKKLNKLFSVACAITFSSNSFASDSDHASTNYYYPSFDEQFLSECQTTNKESFSTKELSSIEIGFCFMNEADRISPTSPSVALTLLNQALSWFAHAQESGHPEALNLIVEIRNRIENLLTNSFRETNL